MNITKKFVAGCVLATTLVLAPASASAPLPDGSRTTVSDDHPSRITVFILADGVGKEYSVPPGSTSRVLESAGVKLGDADQLSSPRDTTVRENQLIVVTRVTINAVDKAVPLPFGSEKQASDVTCEDSSQKIATVTEGKAGEKVETWSEVTIEGVAQAPVKLSEVVKEKPVTEVKADCAPPKPVVVEVTGTKSDWMRAAGIPESDWQYVDYIVNRESSWNPNAVNPSSGACGLAQALPCSKLGPNWNDPVTALKWQYEYVKQRYGGYAGAYNFWTVNHWY